MDSVHKILDDLYAIDPSLRMYAQDLEQVVKKILAAKPDTKFDASFAARLKNELALKIPESSAKGPFFSKLLFAAAGVAIGIIIAVPATLRFTQTVADRVTVAPSFTTEQPEAFGPLVAQNTASSGPAYGRGGGSGSAVAPMMASDAKMIAPGEPYQPTYYRYTYSGDLTVPSDKNQVFKRVAGAAVLSPMEAQLPTLAIPGFSAKSFTPARLRSIDFYQTRGGSYSVNVNTDESTFSVYQNSINVTPPQAPLAQDQYLSDDQIVEIATSFVNAHGMDSSRYGTPVVDASWKLYYAQALAGAEQGMPVWGPEETFVRYPLLIQGTPVVDDSGNPFGLQVSVNHRTKRVNNVFGYYANAFTSSAYVLATADDLKPFIAKGGLYDYLPEQGSFIDATLAEPKFVYLNYTLWHEAGLPTQLFVPAYAFAVQDAPADGSGPKRSVVVPLVKELLQQQSAVPQPMPYLMNK